MQEDPKGGGRRRDGRRGRDGATKTKTRETRLTDGRRAIGAEGQGRGHDLGGLKGSVQTLRYTKAARRCDCPNGDVLCVKQGCWTRKTR